jgi:hypothetical protein
LKKQKTLSQGRNLFPAQLRERVAEGRVRELLKQRAFLPIEDSALTWHRIASPVPKYLSVFTSINPHSLIPQQREERAYC